jgi:hypothetical protein
VSNADFDPAGLGLKTADRVAAPEPEAVRGEAIRWTQRRRDIFNFLEPVNISLVATDGPVSVMVDDRRRGPVSRLGHNRGVWPARVVKGAARRDTATTTWNKFPGIFLGTQARLWTLREADRDRLALSIVDLIAARAERDGGLARLDKGFEDLGPELDLELFELEMHDAAGRLGIVAWDDDGLVRWFDSIGRRFDAIKADRPDYRWGERFVAHVAAHDVAEIAKELKGGR